MNIGSGSGYPESKLSNFAPNSFVIDGVECASMEGFLQSLKFKNPAMQVEVCKLVGKAAKFKGKKKNHQWRRDQTLYWRGEAYKRNSIEYQQLLDRAFDALSENDGFRRALLATSGANLTHSIGKHRQSETVLTEGEFISRLIKIRTRLEKEENV